MTREEILADLQATVDYAARIKELADKFEFDEACDIVDALERVKKAIADAQSFVDGELLRQLEAGDRVHNGETFKRVRKYTERTDHDAVVKAVVNTAALHDTPHAAAYAAAATMQRLYLNKSVGAKKGEIDKLSVPRDAVFSREYTGWKVEREPT